MVHPPRPGAQCRHHTPEGLSSSSTCASLQHSEQSPQRRSDMLSGIFVSLLMTGTDLSHEAWQGHGSILSALGMSNLVEKCSNPSQSQMRNSTKKCNPRGGHTMLARTIFAILALATVMMSQPRAANAAPYWPWCSQYGGDMGAVHACAF